LACSPTAQPQALIDRRRRIAVQSLGYTAGRLLLGIGSAPSVLCAAPAASSASSSLAAPAITSLSTLALTSLRERNYSASFQFEQGSINDFLVSYRSDGLRVYARVIAPPAQHERPPAGWPVVVYAHGWVGQEGAPGYRFGLGSADSMAPILSRFVQAGYVVLVPGFRGHGTVKGVPAEGTEWIKAYDNGSYLSPIFYAVDVLHALQAMATIDQAVPGLQVDPKRIYLTGHSQGGDAALTALAVSSSAQLPLKFAAASIWAGCFEGRIEQGRFYGAMEASADALKDPRFMHVMPSWWKPSMYTGTIEQGQQQRQQQMYVTARSLVADQADAHPQTRPLDAAMVAIDAIKHPQFIRVPLQLHFSDMDHYSPPAWNERLARAVNAIGGRAEAHRYSGNTHSFRVEPGWSPAGSEAGIDLIAARSLTLFR
jgi:dienelactone hydrolase